MNKIIKTILVFSISVVFFSCQKENEIGRVNFNLRIDDHYSYNENKSVIIGMHPELKEDDEIQINDETYLVDNRSGSLSVYDVAKSPNDKYYAVYPASWVNGEATATTSITFPEMQFYSEDASHNQIVQNPMIAYATSGNSTLSFKNVAALVSVQITNNYNEPLNVKYITISTESNKLLSGIGSIDFDKDYPEIKLTSGSNNVSIDCTELHTLATSGDNKTATVTLAIPPINSDAKLTVNVCMTGNGDDIDKKYSFRRTTTNDKTIGRSQLGTIMVDLTDDTYTSMNVGLFWGSGTSTDPYLINNIEDFILLRDIVTRTNDYDGVNNDETYNKSGDEGTHYRQMCNIDLTPSAYATWGQSSCYAIGSTTYPFKATYDGGRNSVTLNVTSAGSQPVGIFGCISGGAYIENLVSRGSVNILEATTWGGGIVGKIIGNSTIDNCKNEAIVTSSCHSSYQTYAIGGICGGIEASGCTVKIQNCTNEQSILASSKTNENSSGISAGGICGEANNAASFTIDNCINKGDVQSRYYTGSGYFYGQVSGGILGYVSSNCSTTVSNCINECSIVSGSTYVGGIIGYSNNGSAYKISIKNCKNSAQIYAWNGNSNNVYSGGIVGWCNWHEIDQCYHSGELYAKGRSLGGIIGYANNSGANSGKVTNCMVDVSATDFSGYQYMGGIIANQRGAAAGSETVENCCFYGTITSNDLYYLAGIVVMGGNIVANTLKANNCLVKGYIPNSNSGTVFRKYNGSDDQNTNFCYANNDHGAASKNAKALYDSDGKWTGSPTGTEGTNYYNQATYKTVGDALRHWVSDGHSTYTSWTSEAIPKLNLSYSHITGYVEFDE